MKLTSRNQYAIDSSMKNYLFMDKNRNYGRKVGKVIFQVIIFWIILTFICSEISNTMKEIVQIIWNKSYSYDEVLVSEFGMDITRKDFLTLSGSEWLNDQSSYFCVFFCNFILSLVINFFLNLIMKRSKESPIFPKVYLYFRLDRPIKFIIIFLFI